MSGNKKARTTITIDPDLWEKAKNHCATRPAVGDRLYSFSELVSELLKAHLEGK